MLDGKYEIILIDDLSELLTKFLDDNKIECFRFDLNYCNQKYCDYYFNNLFNRVERIIVDATYDYKDVTAVDFIHDKIKENKSLKDKVIVLIGEDILERYNKNLEDNSLNHKITTAKSMTYKVYGNKKGYKNKLQTVLEIVKDDLKRMKNIEECVINDNEALIKLGEVFSKNKEEILNFFNLYKSIIKYEGELSSIDILNDCELSNHYHNFAQMVFIINNESIDKSIKQKEIKIENDDEFLEVFERLIRSYRKLNKFVSELCHVSNNYSNDYLERMVSRIFNCYIEFENFNTVEIMKYKIKMRFAKIRKSLHKK